MRRKVFSILLSLAMVITMMPAMTMMSLAEETGVAPAPTVSASNDVSVLMLKATKTGSKYIKLSWNKVSGATKYKVYGNIKGKKLKNLATLKSSKKSYTVKKIKGTKLKAHKVYMFYVQSYKGKKKLTKLAKSRTIAFVTAKTMGKYANPTKITASETDCTVAVGSTKQLTATVTMPKGKKHLSSKYGTKLIYKSNNPSVATVDSKGLVTGVSVGDAKIYIQDLSGLYCTTTVKVLSQDEVAFNTYKQEVLTKCDALLKSDSTYAQKTLVANAKAKINNLQFDSSKSLTDNKAAIDSIYNELKNAISGGEDNPSGPTPAPSTYTVTFDMQGHGTQISSEAGLASGAKATKPTDPTAAGFTFGGWYREATFTTEWNFDTDTVTSNTTLYAKWTAKETAIEEAVVHGSDIQADGKIVKITSGDGKTALILTEDQANELANKINDLLKNSAVADSSGNGLKESTKINNDGLSDIISKLKDGITDNVAKKNLEYKTSADVDLQIKVVLSTVNVNSTEDLTVTSMEFDVTPIATTTVKDSSGKTVSVSADIKSCLTSGVKFRLPIDSSLNDTGNSIAVYHEGKFLGNYEIKGDTPNTYIEIESRYFSKYSYQLLNANNAGATIGDTLYFKFADAVADVENDETITLLKPANGELIISKEISFTVYKNGKDYYATLSAGDGYILNKTNEMEQQITYSCLPKKISDILPAGFPTSDDSAWVTTGGKKTYIDGDDIKVANLTLGKDVTVTKSGDNYVCTSGDATVTFNIKDGAVESITVTGSTDSNGTYVPAGTTFKAVYDTTNDANTLTFYYDAVDHSGEGTVYENGLFDNSQSMGAKWGYNSVRNSVKNVVIDESVKNYDGLTSTAYMFFYMNNAQNIKGAENLDVSNVTDMTYMFGNYGSNTIAFTEVPDVSKWNTSKVENMTGVFYYYAKSSKDLAEVPDVSKWNTSNVTSMESLFNTYGQSSAILNKVPNVSEWDTSKVTNMFKLFNSYAHDSKDLTEVPDVKKWKTGSVTNMSFMFNVYGYTSIKLNDVPNVRVWDTSKVENMKNMFSGYGYTSEELMEGPVVSDWDTTKVEQMEVVFKDYGYNSTKLKDVPDVSNWKTGNVTNMKQMFDNYGNASTNISCVLDLSGWDLSKITGTNGVKVFNFNPKTFNVTIPAKTGDKDNDSNNWYYGDGTNTIAPPAGKSFTLAAKEMTVADVLPEGFPTSKDVGWKNEYNFSMFKDGSNLVIYKSDGHQVDTVPLETVLTKYVNTWKCSSSSYDGSSFTFNMNGDNLVSIEYSYCGWDGYNYADGTYTQQ